MLAVMPVAAQAVTQHWYRNNAKMVEGTPQPIVMFGSKVNLSQTSGVEEVNCRIVGSGTIENPIGGGAGVGRTNAFASYGCKGGACENAALEKKGLEARASLTAQNNPGATQEPEFLGWTDELEESTVAGVSSVREKIGEPFETFKTPSPPGMVRLTEPCEVLSTHELLVSPPYHFEGELKPEIGVAKSGNLNGTKAGVPSTMKFNGTSGGALHSSEAGEGKWEGMLKYLGYNEQEVITVKP